MANESQGKPEKSRRTGTRICGSVRCNQKGQRKKRRDCFEAWGRCCDEADAAQNQEKSRGRRTQAMLWNVQSNMGVCGQTEVVAEKAWQLSERSNTKSQTLDEFFFFSKGMVIERGWDRQGRNDKLVVSMQISIKQTPSIVGNAKAQG